MPDNKHVPLLIYGPGGERKIIGDAEVDGEKIVAEVTDPRLRDQIFGNQMDSFSIGEKAPSTGGRSLGLGTFDKFVRRPFTVEAVEVTEENIFQIAVTTGELCKREDGTTYIRTNHDVVPNVNRIYVGFWVTLLGQNLRAYSAKTFHEMFEKKDSS